MYHPSLIGRFTVNLGLLLLDKDLEIDESISPPRARLHGMPTHTVSVKKFKGDGSTDHFARSSQRLMP